MKKHTLFLASMMSLSLFTTTYADNTPLYGGFYTKEYSKQELIPQPYTMEAKKLHQSAEQGNADAQTDLGNDVL